MGTILSQISGWPCPLPLVSEITHRRAGNGHRFGGRARDTGTVPDNEVVAVLCAIGAATSYALSNVLQQHEAEQVSEEETHGLGLLDKFARRPRWLIGTGAGVGGYVFEALALGAGTLVLVEPILATALIFSLAF